MLKPAELEHVNKTWLEKRDDYAMLSDYVLERCVRYRQQNPNVARIIFSREPKVKTLQSITQKIELCRKEVRSFSYDDLTDIVALTVLCPYDSDISQFVEWMRGAFRVETSEGAALKDYDSGHSARHYTVKPTDLEIVNNPDLHGICCEIQVKTILQEAFDAKSHDLAYKPGRYEVGDDLKKQFGLLASALKAVDRQSEFLKDLIIREQREVDLRRQACLNLFLRQEETTEIGKSLKIDFNKTLPVVKVAKILDGRSKKLKKMDVAFCKFAALCALKLEHEMLREKAISYAKKLTVDKKDKIASTIARGGILWVLGRFEDAMKDMIEVVRLASSAGDRVHLKQAKNNYVYYVCDWKLFLNQSTDAGIARAKKFVDEILALGPAQGNEADTIGLFKILFGKTADEIEEGRALIKRAKRTRRDDIEIYQKFYDLHNYVSLNRLMKLLRQKP
jgi:ppGpp synthetase/RelA/SpoT-type nucleotidyltranferase